MILIKNFVIGDWGLGIAIPNPQSPQFKFTLNIFNIFNPLLQLEIYDKISIIENINYTEYKFIDISKINFGFYLDKYNIYQSITRWYYNQKREYIFNKLDIFFGLFYFA